MFALQPIYSLYATYKNLLMHGILSSQYSIGYDFFLRHTLAKNQYTTVV